MAFIGGEMGSAPETAEAVSRPLVSATLWAPGEEPRECDLSNVSGEDGVLWIDIPRTADASELLAMLNRTCLGLTREMLEDLIDPDKEPVSRRWCGGDIRLVSTFAVYPCEGKSVIDWAPRRAHVPKRRPPRPAKPLA